MTLDEIIKHCEEVAEVQYDLYDCYLQLGEQGDHVQNCLECGTEHLQVAEWLKLLKRILESGDCNECGIKKVCNIRPEWGEQVRYNCHMFVRGEQE